MLKDKECRFFFEQDMKRKEKHKAKTKTILNQQHHQLQNTTTQNFVLGKYVYFCNLLMIIPEG